MGRLRRAAIIWLGSILMPIALGIVCGVTLNPLGSGIGQPVAGPQRLITGICGVGAVAALLIVIGVLSTEVIVLALTALLDLLVARWLPKGSRRFAFYRAGTGIVGGFIGGGLIGLPFAQAAMILPALLVGPIIGLILNLPVGRRISPFLEHRAQQEMTQGRLGLLGAIVRARRAFRTWLTCAGLGVVVGLALVATELGKADNDLRSGLSSAFATFGLAYATMGSVAALAAWWGFLAIAAATLADLAWDALARHLRTESPAFKIASMAPAIVAGAVAAGLGASPMEKLSIIAAAVALGAVAGFAVAWPRLRL